MSQDLKENKFNEETNINRIFENFMKIFFDPYISEYLHDELTEVCGERDMCGLTYDSNKTKYKFNEIFYLIVKLLNNTDSLLKLLKININRYDFGVIQINYRYLGVKKTYCVFIDASTDNNIIKDYYDTKGDQHDFKKNEHGKLEEITELLNSKNFDDITYINIDFCIKCSCLVDIYKKYN
jgi:hypothetical protein